ncbi:MAG: hypothetical protein JSR96_03265 [Proteobacteria bacterium]|nr:hypothetical protein [Pseudomonadota bacterium]
MLSLIFAAGSRPDAEKVIAAGKGRAIAGGFAISHRPDPAEGWLELLASGLTFDCHGLIPGEAQTIPPPGALLGLDAIPPGEATTLQPGPHIAAGRGLLPVVRVMVGVASRLAALDGVVAAYWWPAGSWMEPAYFRRVIGDWLSGGAFPALGLTSLRREGDGAMVSRGLGLLIGQELRFEPQQALSAGAVARISVRLIHELIGGGALTRPQEFIGPDGELLLATPTRDSHYLHVIVRRDGE